MTTFYVIISKFQNLNAIKMNFDELFSFSVYSKVFSTTKEGQMASEEWARWLKTDETRAFAVEEKEEVFKYRSIFAFETKIFSLFFFVSFSTFLVVKPS
jgi:hypothetical protein